MKFRIIEDASNRHDPGYFPEWFSEDLQSWIPLGNSWGYPSIDAAEARINRKIENNKKDEITRVQTKRKIVKELEG